MCAAGGKYSFPADKQKINVQLVSSDPDGTTSNGTAIFRE